MKVLPLSRPGPLGRRAGGRFHRTATGELRAESVHKLISSPSGPSRAFYLIFESSSVTKEGDRVVLS